MIRRSKSTYAELTDAMTVDIAVLYLFIFFMSCAIKHLSDNLEAVNQLEVLRFSEASLNCSQAQQFYKRMCVKTKLLELYLKDCCGFSHREVNPNFFAGGLSKLSKLSMRNSPRIETEQILELLSRITRSSSPVLIEVNFF